MSDGGEMRRIAAMAWEVGYIRGTLDATSDLEPADNPWLSPAQSVCWLNEDCIAGHHMDETPCRFPSWADDERETGKFVRTKAGRWLGWLTGERWRERAAARRYWQNARYREELRP